MPSPSVERPRSSARRAPSPEPSGRARPRAGRPSTRRAGRAATGAISSRTAARRGARPASGAAPGRPSAIRASRAASGGSATPASARIASIGAGRHRAEAEPRAARRTVGRRRSSSSAQRMIVTPAGGSSSVFRRARLGVVGQAVGALDDRDPGAALDRQQHEVATPAGGRSRPPGRSATPIRIWSPGPRRREAMDVRMAAALDEPATAARRGTAGPPGPGRRTAGPRRDRARASSCRCRPGR